jgi:RimJ/RimL family protein N-acetyltransferase
MKLSTAVRHVVDQTRAFGPAAALHDLQMRAVNRAVHFHILKGMTAVHPDIDPRLLDPGEFAARFATRDELLAAAARPEIAQEMSPAFVESALARGDDCFALFDGEALAAFGWYSAQPTPISDDLVLHFDPTWIYMYKGYTLPAYRGKRLHGVGMSMALADYAQRGARGLIAYVNSNNFQSLRSIRRMGYRVFGEVLVLRAFGRVLTWSTPGCRPYAFRVESRVAREPSASASRASAAA